MQFNDPARTVTKLPEFSVLQLLSQDAELPMVIALENSWKERLHSRVPFGLNSN